MIPSDRLLLQLDDGSLAKIGLVLLQLGTSVKSVLLWA